MKATPSLTQLQKEHVVMELECIDRMYLNAYVPQLTSEAGLAAFCRGYLGHRFASTKQAVEMTQRFVRSIEAFIQREGLELVRFQKGQRKDQVLQEKRRRFSSDEGVIFVGVAQEKVRVPRTTRKRLESGGTIPWIIYSTALVNVCYFYCRDRDFGPFFLKFCSYFPYSAKLCPIGLAVLAVAFALFLSRDGPKTNALGIVVLATWCSNGEQVVTFRSDPTNAGITFAELVSASDDGKTQPPTVRSFGHVFPVPTGRETNFTLHFVALPKPGASVLGRPLAYTPGTYTVAYTATESAHRVRVGIALEQQGIGDYVGRLRNCWVRKSLRPLGWKSCRDPVFVTSEPITNAVPTTR